jgi:hypothetical protein
VHLSLSRRRRPSLLPSAGLGRGPGRELKQLALSVLCLVRPSLSLFVSRVLECISSHQLSVLSREAKAMWGGEWEAGGPRAWVLKEMRWDTLSYSLFSALLSRRQHQKTISADGRTPFRNWQFLKKEKYSRK